MAKRTKKSRKTKDTSVSFRDKKAALQAQRDLNLRLSIHFFYKNWLMSNIKLPF
jgi:hypothetical protein